MDQEILTLDPDGVWHTRGPSGNTEVTHGPTVQAFFRGIRRHKDGLWRIHVGRESKVVQVEDTGFFVTAWHPEKEEISLSDGQVEKLSGDSLAYAEGRLICRIQRDGESYEARFVREAYHHFIHQVERRGDHYTVTLAGKTWPLT